MLDNTVAIFNEELNDYNNIVLGRNEYEHVARAW